MIAIINFFGSIKNMMIAIGSLLLVGYVGKLKYDSYQAESKLKDIEHKIAKTNVIVAKNKAVAKAKAKKVETDTEAQVLRELKKEAKVIEKDMITIEKEIEKRLKSKNAVTLTRKRRGNKIVIDI